MSSITGAQFNERYAGVVMVKLTNDTENHFGYHFTTGDHVDPINLDTNPFGPGGFNFCELSKLPMWLTNGDEYMQHCRIVVIPGDAHVFVQFNKFKTNKFTLLDPVKITDLDVWNDPAYCMNAIKQSKCALKYIPIAKHTSDLYLLAVKKHWTALKYISPDRITFDMCVIASQQNGLALQYVPEIYKSNELCKIADNLQFLNEDQQTEELCTALAIDGTLIRLIPEALQTFEICMAAVCNTVKAFLHITPSKRSYAICMWVAHQDGYMLEHMSEDVMTPELCLAAINNNYEAYKLIPKRKRTPWLDHVAMTKLYNDRPSSLPQNNCSYIA
jgi:hypothetical protein